MAAHEGEVSYFDFTRLLMAKSPGRFVWKDDQCVAFMDIMPLSKESPTARSPRCGIDRWPDLLS